MHFMLRMTLSKIMYYGIYRGIRDGAWKCLRDFGVTSLPVKILPIAKACNIHVIKNSIVHDLEATEIAKAYFTGTDWHFIYDDTRPQDERRYALAHEFGHFFLGHPELYQKYKPIPTEDGKPSKSEMQADDFAIRLLCPASVIWGLNLRTAEEIAEVCNVPLEIAKKRCKRMALLYKRDAFLTSPLEREVYENFKPFIEEKKKELLLRQQ